LIHPIREPPDFRKCFVRIIGIRRDCHFAKEWKSAGGIHLIDQIAQREPTRVSVPHIPFYAN
jgi:hypothetical protein